MSTAGAPTDVNAALSRRERKAQAWRGRRCENCEAMLQGPFCHRCGQPERTPIRDLVALSTDAVDYLFDVDARLWKTLRDLFFRPGRLTEGYLRGKRMSFVRPMRVYLVISALLFVVVSSMSDMDGLKVNAKGDVVVLEGDTPGKPDDAAPETAPTRADAEAAPAPPAEPESTPGSKAFEQGMRRVAEGVERAANAAEAAAAKAEAEAKDGHGEARDEQPVELPIFNDKPWHPQNNPVAIGWLPEVANVWLNETVGVIHANLGLARKDPKRLGHAFLRVLPQSLFVLLPVFALLLKLVFVFKRRLYMEHLMVAVHSHTFIYMGILVMLGLSFAAEHWPAAWINPWWTLMGLAIAWIPLNLFLTQKRVYRQGWWSALIAYLTISTLYLCLIGFTVVGALVASLVSL